MRIDVYLVQNGYTQSRQRAQVLIAQGCVFFDGMRVDKPSNQVEDCEHDVKIHDTIRYVGRGGLKLEAALDAFKMDVTDFQALDIGASTGGFTDCLLQRGAKQVFAVDSGEKLVNDCRVTALEHYNARNLDPKDLQNTPIDLIVMDVSFISATYIIPRFPFVLRPGGCAIVLIKPQFEVGKSMIGKGGIVKDPKAHRYAIERVLESVRASNMVPTGLTISPIPGGDGNREFLIRFEYMTQNNQAVTTDDITRVTGARCSI